MQQPTTNAWIERTKINLSWLHKMRWAAIAGQLATIVIVQLWLQVELPIAKMLAVIALAAATNLGLGLWLRSDATRWPTWFGRG
ncbi:MAG TPA: hypothetical protein VHV77_05090, partial [Pirellulales bacterium]|nr:hypothetical protein [Pirellulales bacterium]